LSYASTISQSDEMRANARRPGSDTIQPIDRSFRLQREIQHHVKTNPAHTRSCTPKALARPRQPAG